MVSYQDRRLRRLEEQHVPSGRPDRWHRIIGDTEAELRARSAELIESGLAAANDGFVCRLIITPKPR